MSEEWLAIFGSSDGTVRHWAPQSGETQSLAQHRGPVNSVAVTAACDRVVSGGHDGAVLVTELGNRAAGTAVRIDFERPVSAVALAPGGRLLCGVGPAIHVCDIDTGEKVDVLEGHRWVVQAVVATAHLVVSGSRDSTVRAWDLEAGTQVRVVSAGGWPVDALALGAGDEVLAGSSDGALRIWNMAAGEEVEVLGSEGAQWPVNAVAAIPGRRKVVAGTNATAISVWDLATGDRQVLPGHGEPVNTVAVSPDGSTLFSGSDDRTLRMWNLADATEIASVGAGGAVNSCVLASTGTGRAA